MVTSSATTQSLLASERVPLQKTANTKIAVTMFNMIQSYIDILKAGLSGILLF